VKNNDLEAVKIAFYGGLKNLEDFYDEENRNLAHLVIILSYFISFMMENRRLWRKKSKY